MTLHEDRHRQLTQQELDARRTHYQAISNAQRVLRKRLDSVDKERERLEGHESDPEVLMRTGPGPTVRIFHSADDYCGRVDPRAVAHGGFKRLFLFEAEELGLRPCTACASGLRSRRRPTRHVA
jgi:hypothetical protein